jgi:raffinose/stachyose/melibiose transport system substrate-binding protein
MLPGRVGHTFQAWNSAWTTDGVERMVAVMEGKGTIANDPVMLRMTQRILELVSFGNADAFSLPDIEGMWEDFAHGKAAMIILGSYARGTLLISNPNINMGVFPLPNDTDATTTLVAGVDAALCVAAGANARQKEAALAYLEFISRTENAQLFCDIEGAPNAVSAVVYPDRRLDPIMDKMKRGPLHDWFAASIPGNVQNAIYNDVQQFLMDKDPARFLAQLQQTIINESR